MHPYWRNEALLAWCKIHEIHVTAFSPLGSPDSASIFPRKLPLELLKEPRVLDVARRSGRNPGQVLIRWALQHGTSVIPKSTSPSRIAGNLQVGRDRVMGRVGGYPKQDWPLHACMPGVRGADVSGTWKP